MHPKWDENILSIKLNRTKVNMQQWHVVQIVSNMQVFSNMNQNKASITDAEPPNRFHKKSQFFHFISIS